MASDQNPSLIDALVAAARARGDFDHLAGHGKPLELADMRALTPAQRLEALLLKTCGELLPEVALIREIRVLRKRLDGAVSASERAELDETLRSKTEQLRLALKLRRTTGRDE